MNPAFENPQVSLGGTGELLQIDLHQQPAPGACIPSACRSVRKACRMESALVLCLPLMGSFEMDCQA
jgi:hypothetical protein